MNPQSDLNKKILKGRPLVLSATLAPVASDRFQPAGFPEIGHVIYKALRSDGHVENVCIVDSSASMANHLESVCLRGEHDYELVEELAGMPYVRCVTGEEVNGALPEDRREVVVTSLTEGHRLASTYFLEGQFLHANGELATKRVKSKKKGKATGKTIEEEDQPQPFLDFLVKEFGIVLPNDKKAHPPSEKWWNVFQTIFRYDPNALVHGVLFPQWQIRIARFLTAHLEAFGAARVDRSGVKFDRLGRTKSGQPIFAVDDVTAREIRATFILDLALLRSFGRSETMGRLLGLSEKQKEFLAALALWKIDRLLKAPFRYRSGCHLELVGLKLGHPNNDYSPHVKLEVDIKQAIQSAAFREEGDKAPIITDVFWKRDDIYREEKEENAAKPAVGATAEDDEGNEAHNDESEGD
ncbi:type I-U CRISPR-associated protein Cas7 [Methylacidimicrobium sp. B4]|uniref:type I-U CRISPR-associated protein Cas7 n=1 Tax=Methylacidimicrobium sp. B4 TaxID=2796139 RepID=UPI001F5CF186|nr:type I-U CRISPR-associated protein Cas7 [Methylacidimicrobium sp. B4]